MRIIFHIDVNSAFLSWSALKQLEEQPGSVDLRTIPSGFASPGCESPDVIHSLRHSLRQLDFSFTRPRFRSESCSIALCRLFACYRQIEGMRCCSGAMMPGSASATAFRSAPKSKESHQLPAVPCEHVIEAEGA